MGRARTRLVVLFGGRSAEHDVSRVTASHVLRAVDPARYEIVAVGIGRDGRWQLAETAMAALDEGPDTLPDALPVGRPAASTRCPSSPPGRATADEPAGRGRCPLLHGPFGEDGTVQGLLELADVPYVGAGVLASALAMDKAKAKEVFAQAGMPQARWLAFRADELPADLADVVGERLGFPCFTKPANLGSSVGVAKVARRRRAGGRGRRRPRATTSGWWSRRRSPAGRSSWPCSATASRGCRCRARSCPAPSSTTTRTSTVDGRAKLLIPAPLPADVAARFQALALAAYRAVRVEGMARVDFFYEEADGPATVGPAGARCSTRSTRSPASPRSRCTPSCGRRPALPYAQLIDELVALAVERWRRRRARTSTDR